MENEEEFVVNSEKFRGTYSYRCPKNCMNSQGIPYNF